MYKAVISKRWKTAYITDDEGVLYMKFLPHPDGDPWMTKESVEIILEMLHIVKREVWLETDTKWEVELCL